MEYLRPTARLVDVQLRSWNGYLSSGFPNNQNQNNNYETVYEDEIDFLFKSDNGNCAISIFRPKRTSGVVITGVYEKIPASKNLLLYVGDIIFNGTDIGSLIEFLIGGRVGISPKAAVILINERMVAPFSEITKPSAPSPFGIQREPEIRSNAFGIKG